MCHYIQVVMCMELVVRHVPAPPVLSAQMATTLTLEQLYVQVSYISVYIAMHFRMNFT